jgi:hypothetical protein
MRKPTNPDLHKPMDLTVDGREAYKAIIAFLEKRDIMFTGGCKAFYSPAAWKMRGEIYGEGSVLIVVHDGGDLSYIFNADHGFYDLNEAMYKQLEEAGFYAEAMNCWSTAIYKA